MIEVGTVAEGHPGTHLGLGQVPTELEILVAEQIVGIELKVDKLMVGIADIVAEKIDIVEV